MAFNGYMLRLARRIRKVSQDELISRLSGDLTQGTLSKIERGRIQPAEEIAEKLALALNVRPSFFYDPAYILQPPVSYHRKRKKLLSSDFSSIHGISEMLRISLAKCLDSIELESTGPGMPSFDLDQFNGDPREAAISVRSRLKLPRGRIANLSKVIEDSGIIVVAFNFGTPLIDGFCQHANAQLPSIIFINSQMPADRMRFSLAHECAHLVCHDIPNPEQEMQANQFASEFLMPSDDIFDELRDFSLNKAMELKLYWGVSMQTLIFKAWQLGRIDDKRKTHLFIEMSRRGWRKNEPVEARGFFEKPSVFEAIIDAHISELGYSKEELSELFGIQLDDLNFYFPFKKKQPSLRIVI